MLISLNWLREMVSLEGHDADSVARELTLAGLEVESIEDRAKPLTGVVVARVVKKEKHPQADKLSLCKVDRGDGTLLDIVCGAKNVAADELVALAPVGAVLPGGLKIKKAKIRGAESFGMLCSEAELGLASESDGIMLLSDIAGAKLGMPLAEALGENDIILELGVTPNRSDALSHLGVARELTASMNARPLQSAPSCAERGPPTDGLVHVSIDVPDSCPRYACRIIDDVDVGPSPAWLVRRLAACGVRAVNNIVDVTNYVMMERGIPMHAFDCQKLGQSHGKSEIIVRHAHAGEVLETLDGVERKLGKEDVVIADPQGAVALAGVMGGARTEVRPTTKRVLLECAHFEATKVRRGAKHHQMHSESSHRFERGTDPNGVIASLDRAASLMAELGGGVVGRGIVDVYAKKIVPAEVSLRPARVAALTGLPPKEVDEGACSKWLTGLGLEVAGREGDAIRFRVPTYRPDLTREIDLVEEIVRLIGFDNIPTTLPARRGRQPASGDRLRAVTPKIADVLLAAGFDQATNLSFNSPEDIKRFPCAAEAVVIQNPLGEEMSRLRQTLYPGLLKNISLNQRHGVEDVRLFEHGVVFVGKNPDGTKPDPKGPGAKGKDAYLNEEQLVSAVLTQNTDGRRSDGGTHDFYTMKGVLEELSERFGIDSGHMAAAIRFEPISDESGSVCYHPRAAAQLKMETKDGTLVDIATVGELHPDIVEAYDVSGSVYGFELSVAGLARVARGVPQIKPIPKFPAVRRDLAFVVDEGTAAGAFCRKLAKTEALRGLLEEVEVFDVYRGEQLPEGKKSLAISYVLRSEKGTLTEKEATKATDVLVQAAREHFSADVRGA